MSQEFDSSVNNAFYRLQYEFNVHAFTLLKSLAIMFNFY